MGCWGGFDVDMSHLNFHGTGGCTVGNGLTCEIGSGLTHTNGSFCMTRRGLAKKIDGWFSDTVGDPNRWRRDPVGRVIREELRRVGNWKNAPRGNPRAGYEGLMRKKNGGSE